MGDRFDHTLEHTLKTKPDEPGDGSDDAVTGVRRIELITGTGRRRQWSDDDKARIIIESLRPGSCVSEVARRNGLSPQQLFGWRRDTRQSALRHGDSSARPLLRGAAESACVRAMTNVPSALPHDVDALHALILAERAAHAAVIAERDQLATHNEKLEHIVAEMRRAMYGRRSERIDDNQLALALEALETAHAKVQAETEKANPALKSERTRQRRKSRTESLDHLPHEEVVIEPESKVCPCCNGALHKIGEDVSKRLDKIPAKLTVVVTRRPKLACRDCEKTGADEVAGIIQAPAPARLIEGGLPTERLVADIVVSKFADHLPLYRQSQILARSGVHIERSTLAHWVGAAAAELQPLHDWLVEQLKKSPKLFCDETRCPVLDPGRGETKTGYMWALARDDRPWGGTDPPAVAYTYAPGRGGVHAMKLLDGFSGVLQVDGYAVYDKLARPTRAGGPVTLAFCWSHLRRKFYELYVGRNQPIATQALARIKLLYDIEAEIRGLPPQVRRAMRQEKARPIVEALKPWLEASLAKVPKGGKLGEALGYGLNQWDGLVRYLDDGRIEIDSNTVERSIRPLALTRKNALFAGHDLGAAGWAMLASLIETCKLNCVDPLAWMTDVLPKLAPRRRAAARPSLARLTMRARSSSATADRNARMPRFIGLARSRYSRSSTLMSAPLSWMRPIRTTPSCRLRVARSHSAMTNTSPRPRASIARSSCGRLWVARPLAVSRKMVSQPAVRSAAI